MISGIAPVPERPDEIGAAPVIFIEYLIGGSQRARIVVSGQQHGVSRHRARIRRAGHRFRRENATYAESSGCRKLARYCAGVTPSRREKIMRILSGVPKPQ